MSLNVAYAPRPKNIKARLTIKYNPDSKYYEGTFSEDKKTFYLGSKVDIAIMNAKNHFYVNYFFKNKDGSTCDALKVVVLAKTGRKIKNLTFFRESFNRESTNNYMKEHESKLKSNDFKYNIKVDTPDTESFRKSSKQMIDTINREYKGGDYAPIKKDYKEYKSKTKLESKHDTSNIINTILILTSLLVVCLFLCVVYIYLK